MEYYMNGPTDLQYKDALRKEKMFYEELIKLSDEGRVEEQKEKLAKEIERINATLMD